jgi:HK97 family phage portal protein
MSTMPLELWPIRPDRIEPVPSKDEFLLGYIYTSPDGEKIPLGRDELLSILLPNPMDPYRGLGPVQALLVDLDSEHAAAQFNRNFYHNDATPGGIIEIDTRLSDPEWREFNERWRMSHQGVSNAHRVAMLENGAKWKDRQYTMRDMQFSELRDLSSTKIREAFGMHGHLLGLTDDINRANAEAAEDVFARWRLRPDLNRIKNMLNEQLLPLFGSSTQGLEFDFDDPSLEDSEATNNALTAKTQAVKSIVDAGGDFESACEAFGLPLIKVDELKQQAAKKALEAPAVVPGQPPNGQSPNGAKKPAEKEPVPA